MSIKFGIIYTEYLDLERELRELEKDIDNVGCEVTKCKLLTDLEKLEDKLKDMENTSIEFTSLDLEDVVESVNNCMDCVKILS